MRPIHLVLLLLTACHPAPQPVNEPVKDALAMASPWAASPPPAATPGATVTLGARTIQVEVADTFESRQRGLSGRESLAPETGLVLLWEQPTVTKIWMPDMNFAIDVIFVRQDHVVEVVSDAQPCVPDGPCPTFGPDQLVDYVLEVPAGSAAHWGLKAGDPITLAR